MSQKTGDINLLPPLVEAGHIADFVSSGQTLSSASSPLDNSRAVFVTPTATKEYTRNESPEDLPIYFASPDSSPSSERRLFITDTSVIYAALQNLLKGAKGQSPDWLQSERSFTMIRKLAIDYVNFTKECWVHAAQAMHKADGALQFSSEHYRNLHTAFSLFVLLYLPEPGYGSAPVGDDLMEWLNTHYIEPSTEEGDLLSGMNAPWEDESFWPYLTRTILRGLSKASVFFLNGLSRHPSAHLQVLAATVSSLLEKQPRIHDFKTEKDFTITSRRWQDKVKALRVEMSRIDERERRDSFENWWDRLSDIVGILEGRGDVIKRICAELGSDWKEVCAAWGVFVDPRLQRQDLADVVDDIMDDMPPDPTNVEDQIHAALLSGRPAQVLLYASQMDPWLSAHLADVMSPLLLLEADADEESGLSLRNQHVLNYCDHLHSDPALWRITVDYMYSCGPIGEARADEILVRVPLRLHEQTDRESQTRIRNGEVVGVLKRINETCFEHGREAVRRTVCRIAAESLVREKQYGLAVSYCMSAEDWPGLGRAIDRVLEEHITNGPVKFARYAADIAPSLRDIQRLPGSQGVFTHRLMFAVRYAQFLHLLASRQLSDAALDLVALFHDDVAPKSWWGVLLCDAVDLLQYDAVLLFSTAGATELLQKLEEVSTRTVQGSGEDYLAVLMRTTKGGSENDALNLLKPVRLALARYFARCTVIGVGGKQGLVRRPPAVP